MDYLEKSKQFFESGDINNTLDVFERALFHIDPIREKSVFKEYITFLKKILEHCKESSLTEMEALVLRTMGRTCSIFKHHIDGLKFHEQSLNIQRKLGNKKDIAEGLVFLAEDLEVSGNYNECINMFTDAAEILNNLGNLKKEKDIRKELERLKKFSKEMVEDEYIMHKYHVDNY